MPLLFTSPNPSVSSDSSNSSNANSLPSSRGSTEAGAEERCRKNLEMHRILVEPDEMESKHWDQLAFALGFPTNTEKRSSPEASKLARHISKKKTYNKKQVIEIIRPVFSSLVTSPEVLSLQHSVEYHYDAVPAIEHLRNSILRLPVPKPVISVGYRKEVFSRPQIELQHGIISDATGAPADLSRVSQTAPGHYWPFLTVEVSDVSLTAARQACAISAGTCNNAIQMLSSAADELSTAYMSRDVWESGCIHCRSFSVAICGRLAALNTHACVEDVHLASTIKVYQLDIENEAAALISRLKSILIWGQHGRLEYVGSTLNRLNERVNSMQRRQHNSMYVVQPSIIHHIQTDRQMEVAPSLTTKPVQRINYDESEIDPVRNSTEALNNQNQLPQRRRRRDMMKIAFEAGLPSFMKEDM